MQLTGKTIVGLSALLSGGLMAGLLVIEGPAQAGTQAPKIVERHPDLSGLPASPASVTDRGNTTTATKRSDRLSEASDCGAQAWPYVAGECVTTGAPRRQVRTITIEKRAGDNTSVLLRVPGQLANN